MESTAWSAAEHGDGPRQMRVLHLVRPAAGGMVRHLQILLPALVAQGLEVVVAGPCSLADAFATRVIGSATAPAGVRFTPLRWTGSLLRRPWAVSALRRSLAQLLGEVKPDIVHLHGLEAAWVGLPVCRRSGMSGMPGVPGVTGTPTMPGMPTAHGVRVCVTLHNELPGSTLQGWLAGALIHPLVNWLMNWLTTADAVILVSPAMPGRLAALAAVAAPRAVAEGVTRGTEGAGDGGPVSKFHLIPNGIDLAANAPLPFPRIEAAEPLRIAIVSRLSREKGVDLICPALRGWNRGEQPLEVRLAGDGPWAERLRRQVEAAGLGGEVRLLGRLSAAGVRDLMAWAEILVLPSRTEGLPLAVLEAMAAGRPVVASRVGGIPWVVRDGEDGWLVDPGRPESLRRGIELAWAHRSQLAAMGAKARQRVAESYSADGMIARTLELYRRLQPQFVCDACVTCER